MTTVNKTLLMILISFSMSMQSHADIWTSAEKEIKRVKSIMFINLSDTIKAEIKKRGCLIPQLDDFFNKENVHNIVKGSFSSEKTNDFAVLCSVNGTSHIEIIWGKGKPCSEKFAFFKDKTYLQGLGENKIGFSRSISVATKESILKHQKAYGGKLPQKSAHFGIDDAFALKASVIYFCDKGEWHEFSGAD